jgi:hypothetical protein
MIDKCPRERGAHAVGIGPRQTDQGAVNQCRCADVSSTVFLQVDDARAAIGGGMWSPNP